VARSCEHCNEPLGSINGEEFPKRMLVRRDICYMDLVICEPSLEGFSCEHLFHDFQSSVNYDIKRESC
jgi:hypothetical protein